MKDLFSWNEDSYSIEVTANKITSSRSRKISKKIATLFKDNKKISVAAIGDQSANDLWSQCEKKFPFARPSTFNPLAITSNSFSHQFKELSNIDFEANVDAFLKDFTKAHDKFIVQGKFTLANNERHYQQDDIHLSSRASLVDSYLCLKHKSSANIIDIVIGTSGDKNINFKQLSSFYSQFLNNWDKEVSIKPGFKNVCFLSGENDLLSKVYQAINPETYHLGAALFSGQSEKQIFHPELTILDVTMNPSNGHYRPFDDEGIIRPVSELAIIEKGTLKAPFFDLRTAHKYNKNSTGNAERDDIPQGTVSVGLNSIVFQGGEKSLETLWQESGEVVVILMAGGGDTTADGDFSTPAQVAFLVKDGIVQGRLPQITLAGNIKEYLGSNFIGIAKDRFASGNQHPLMTKLNLYLN